MGRTSEFTVKSPEKNLRQRLLLDQDLPYASSASLGSKHLEEIEHWPETTGRPAQGSECLKAETALDIPAKISLVEALQIAAGNSREYQNRKEKLFREALALDFERNDFRTILSGSIDGEYTENRTDADTEDGTVSGWKASGTAALSRKLLNGLTFTARLGLDLVQMLEPARFFTRGLFGDASITVPLPRGSGRHIVSEPLTRAERA
ncbi:MAG: hypothetical protein R6V20_05905, partial [Desulfobia sp.]